MNRTELTTTTLKENFTTYLTADIYAPERLAEWCKKNYPAVEYCRLFREQLRIAILAPGTVSPEMYERWTGDEDYPTQEMLQNHLNEIWKMCFPGETMAS